MGREHSEGTGSHSAVETVKREREWDLPVDFSH